MVAPVGIVPDKVRHGELIGVNDQMADTDLLSHPTGGFQLEVRKRGGHSRDGNGTIAQRIVGDLQDQRAVNAA